VELERHLERVKPRLRGILHQVAFFVSLVTGPILIWTAGVAGRIGALIYSVAMSGLFGVSALYHRLNWRPRVRAWLRRLDHTMIFVFIASSFTPLGLILGTSWARIVLIAVWSAVAVAVLIRLFPFKVPKPVAVIPYLALGWLGVTLFPGATTRLGWAPTILFAIGGLAYTAGAIVYARRRPDPKPATFGYHEIFHAFVILGAYLHYAAIAGVS